ncbi:DUF1993 domain-containing protein [Allopontixanthobacter sp.]|uniref:DUF1993 domain-containing protein n=1 Tax=Allopontixanthobacter sp. TaxID=2906452 RepID=UPI002ABB12B6|nr:DUF1993 domain-containing protein [Allopontixanthobacter sp.]MDZ4306960.1 DUF1993 domain-containing protein [Allopontixanthobacter sp.]
MALSLHSALIPSMVQITRSVSKLVDKAEAHCEENSLPHSEIIGARLAENMLPFAYQVKCCWAHSSHAVASVREGVFTPDMSPFPDSFAGLREVLAKAVDELEAITEAELEELAGKDMRFEIPGKYRIDFTGQEFLLSFAQPNFYFHASTAYDILRMKGLPLGKTDYLGKLRLKG